MKLASLTAIDNAKRQLNGCIANQSLELTVANFLNQASICINNQQRALSILPVNIQGEINNSDIPTNVAIRGNGMFLVKDLYHNYSTLLTRDGSFKMNQNGNLANIGGYELQGLPLYGNANLPFTLDNLESVNLANNYPLSINNATTKVKLSLNLKSSEIQKGVGKTISFHFGDVNNYEISAYDVISPENSMPYILNIGDIININPYNTQSNYNYSYNFTYGGVSISKDITQSPILGAINSNAIFSQAEDGWSFYINISNFIFETFTYISILPNISLNQFNSLITLASAINNTEILISRLNPSNQYILISTKNANMAINFVDITPATFVASLEIANTSLSTNRFSSLENLANLINSKPKISATIFKTYNNYNLNFYTTDLLGNLTFNFFGSNFSNIISSHNSIANTFNIFSNQNNLGPYYDMEGYLAPNMASGIITPNFVINNFIYDTLGCTHDLLISFIKISPQTWVVEIFLENPQDIISSRSDGQISRGYIIFNGDGSLNDISPSLSGNINIDWVNQAYNSQIIFFWQLMQLDTNYCLNFINQDGFPPELHLGFIIDINGILNISYSHYSISLYQIPLALVTNDNGLVYYDLNAFLYDASTSGNISLYSANQNPVGDILSGSLEKLYYPF